MNTRNFTLAIAALAGFGAAQIPEATDTAAREQAQKALAVASQAGNEAAAAKAATAQVAADLQARSEKIDAIDGKLTGLEESYLETKGTVDALKKMKISGLLQVEYKWYLDTANTSEYSLKQGAWSIRRGRIKFSYDAGNGTVFVFQPNFNESSITTKDAYLQYTEQYLKAFTLKAGIQDIPFGYEIGYSSSSIEYLERSLFERNAMFKDEKDLGAVASFQSEQILPWLNAKIGWMNGNGVATAQQDPLNLVGRVGFNWAQNDLGLAIDGGASYYFDSKRQTTDTLFESSEDGLLRETGHFRKFVNSSIAGADLQTYYEIPGFGAVKLVGEGYFGNAVGNKENVQRYTGAASSIAYKRPVLGWYAGAIVNPVGLLPQLQVVYRFDYFDPNTDVSGDEVDASKGFNKGDVAYTANTFGVNWFLNGNTKLCLHYDMVSNEETKVSKYTTDRDDDVLTFRIQTAF